MEVASVIKPDQIQNLLTDSKMDLCSIIVSLLWSYECKSLDAGYFLHNYGVIIANCLHMLSQHLFTMYIKIFIRFQSDSESDPQPSRQAASRVQGLMRPTISSMNKATANTARRRGLVNSYSTGTYTDYCLYHFNEQLPNNIQRILII